MKSIAVIQSFKQQYLSFLIFCNTQAAIMKYHDGYRKSVKITMLCLLLFFLPKQQCFAL